ncbi:triphosphoribosyl-dephospho-CoA synthase [Tepidibacillus marianensis]|uniref:triphosphoribosyl-dephospho-CoA synthase n=1 Tax=Tepidibacillus marianensis TaxID=3131995 RepID=UPI0030D10085
MKYEVKGIRGEVEAGFPSIKEVGLPAFYDAIKQGADLNSSLVYTLISLMTKVEDTTILWRKNMDTLIEVQQQAQEILDLGSVFTTEGLEAIHQLDKEFIKENISPGGSADLLSITIGIYLLENKQFPMSIL